MMKIKYMNYDITLSLSEELNIKVLDTHTFDIYDRSYTKIEEITKFNGLTLTNAHNIIDSFFNKQNPNIVADIKKSKSDEKLCISLTYTKKDEFTATFNILLIFELDKQTIDDTEKRYSQLLYKIINLEATMDKNMIDITEKRFGQLLNKITNLEATMEKKMIDIAEKRFGQLLHKINNLEAIIMKITNRVTMCIQLGNGSIVMPYNITKLNILCTRNNGNNNYYDNITNKLFLYRINSSISFSDTGIEELCIDGDFDETGLNAIPTLKKLSWKNITTGAQLEIYGSLSSLEELSIINWPTLRTIKDILPNKKIKIILQNVSPKLAAEIPILRELGHTVEYTY